jgi:hypothetical protein
LLQGKLMRIVFRNSPAYFAMAVIWSSFIDKIAIYVANVTNFYCLTNGPNKLYVFVPSRPYRFNLMFVVKVRRDRSLPLRKLLKGSCLSCKHQTTPERLARGQHSTFFGPFVIYYVRKEVENHALGLYCHLVAKLGDI